MTDSTQVYVVDDNADYLFLVQQVFKRFLAQYSVAYFDHAQALLDHLTTHSGSPQLILSDLYMPDLTGIQMLIHLKQDIAQKRIPVVIISSSSSLLDINHCYDAGANSCLLKTRTFDQMHHQLHLVCQYWLGANQPVCPPANVIESLSGS